MALVSSTVPNLVGGISQQPDELRLTNTCEDMLNTWPSIVNGLQKRPALRHVANIGTALSSGACGYLIERNETYRYLSIIENGDLKVLDLNTGSYQTVSFPNGKSYLAASSPIDAFRFVTFGDFTFISNKSITVGKSAVSEPVAGATRRNPATEGTVYVTQSIFNTYYSVYVNGVLKAEYLTPDGASGSAACPDTGQIAEELKNDLVTNGYTCIRVGSTVTITTLTAGDKLQSQGGSGDKSVRVFTTEVQSFSDLPPSSPEGRIVRVAGDVEAAGDDYYVIYQNGIWRETLNYGAGERLTASTMPHVLVRNVDGTWTFKQHIWKDRTVGDAESSRSPSFVGSTINDIFVYTNRLGILADENIILSEADVFENFYRSTCAQLIDSDLIDLAVLHNNVDVINHAVPYNRDLLLMSEKNQFRFTYQNFLGQKTVSVQFSTSFPVSPRVPPVNVGNSVYFVDDRTDYSFSKMYEFFPKDNSTVDDADDVSAPIPEFLKTDVRFMAASNRAKCIVLYSGNDPTSLYAYKYFWAGDRKVQSAWTKWSFTDCNKIYWADFSGTFLYLLIERPNGVFLERMRLDEDVFDLDTNYELLLDRRYTLLSGAMSYNSALDKTTITLPYSTSLTVEVVSSDIPNGVYGIRQPVTRINASEVTVPGNVTGLTNVIGLPYVMSYEFSKLFARQQKNNGEVVMLDGRTQIRYLTVQYHNTAYFQTKLSTPGRDDHIATFSGMVLGSQTSLLGKQAFASGKYRMPVMSENLKARLFITNDSPFPCAFGSAEWQGIIAPKSAQRL